MEVYPPRLNAANGSETPGASSSNGAPNMSGRKPVHGIGGDLKVPAKEVNKEDDPNAYLYRIQIVEEEKPEGARDKMAVSTREARLKWHGSVMEVKCNIMRFVLLTKLQLLALMTPPLPVATVSHSPRASSAVSCVTALTAILPSRHLGL